MSENGKYFEQNAVTAAFRKALGYLGFGTPIDAHEVDGIYIVYDEDIPEMTDMGVLISKPKMPVFSKAKSSEAENSLPKPVKTVKAT